MNSEELQKTLSALHRELSQVSDVDEATRQRLRDLIADMERLIGPGDQPPDESQDSLSANLQDMISRFEARHPQLTATVQQIVDRLAEIGI